MLSDNKAVYLLGGINYIIEKQGCFVDELPFNRYANAEKPTIGAMYGISFFAYTAEIANRPTNGIGDTLRHHLKYPVL